MAVDLDYDFSADTSSGGGFNAEEFWNENKQNWMKMTKTEYDQFFVHSYSFKKKASDRWKISSVPLLVNVLPSFAITLHTGNKVEKTDYTIKRMWLCIGMAGAVKGYHPNLNPLLSAAMDDSVNKKYPELSQVYHPGLEFMFFFRPALVTAACLYKSAKYKEIGLSKNSMMKGVSSRDIKGEQLLGLITQRAEKGTTTFHTWYMANKQEVYDEFDKLKNYNPSGGGAVRLNRALEILGDFSKYMKTNVQHPSTSTSTPSSSTSRKALEYMFDDDDK